jgi:hypothetical protein
MQQYTEKQTIRLSKTQRQSLLILESKGVNVSQFIRLAIKEKLQRDWKSIKEKSEKSKISILK